MQPLKGMILARDSCTFSGAPPLALVADTRASPNLKIKHKQQNNSFAIILLFNNMLLSYSSPPANFSRPAV